MYIYTHMSYAEVNCIMIFIEFNCIKHTHFPKTESLRGVGGWGGGLKIFLLERGDKPEKGG